MYEENMGREFGWDDEISNDSGFTLLPKGEYPFEVTAFERGRFDGSAKLPPCKMALLTIRIDGGDLGSVSVQHRLYLHTKCEGLLCAFFESVGLRKHGEALKMPWEYVIGTRGTAKVGIHDYVSKGEDRQINQIERFLPPAEETASAPAPAGWQRGAF